jgi:hypothetical protein
MISDDGDKSKSYKIRAEILEKHLKQFGRETKPEAYEFISRNIDLLKKKAEFWEMMRRHQ